MLEINLFDSNFVGQSCSVATQTPKLMRYVHGLMLWHGITVFTDRWMFDPVVDEVDSRFKIGWLHEGRCLHPENYGEVWKVAHKFDAIMTHDAELLSSGGFHFDTPDHRSVKHVPFLKTIRGGSWVAADQWGMYPKSKNVSMILSEKRQTDGHKLRHAIAEAGLPIDCYGPEHTPIGYDKSLAYKDYRFAVVVEACREDNFFSEHLIDAIAYGCIPLYWGCPNIHEYFDPESQYTVRGIWSFKDMNELIDRLEYAVPFFYHQPPPQEWVSRHLRTARQYAITEDWQIQNCLRPFVEAL